MKKILILGGAGFIGFHLVDYLSGRKGYKIHLVDNLSRGKVDGELKDLIKKRDIKFIKKDLTRKDSFRGLDNDYDYIYHLSAIVGVRNVLNNPGKVLFVNIATVLNLLEWANKTQKSLKNLLFTSTSEVYAGTLKYYKAPVPTDENVNICLDNIAFPRTAYALSKIAGESACLNYFSSHDLPIVIVRLHNVYGPRMGYDHVIPELMIKAKNSRKYLEVFSVTHTRAFCYVSDAISAIVKLTENKRTSGQIFNVGNSREEISMGELAKRIIQSINPRLRIRIMPVQPGSVKRRCPDINKLQEAVNFRPQISLNEGIKLTWDWYSKANG
jgi:nucleoside-diphosphate-sugar epimerase